MHSLRRNNTVVAKYALVGGTSFLFEYSTFIFALNRLHLGVLAANTISFCVGLITSFSAQRYWTFSHPESKYNKRIHHQFALYLVLAIVNFAISTLMVLAIVWLTHNKLLAKLLSVIVVALWNYFVMRQKIFTIEQANSDK